MNEFKNALNSLKAKHEELLSRKNEKMLNGNGIYDRYVNPL